MLPWQVTDKMLTEFTTISDNSSADALPVSFITMDDGRTVLAVTEHENGMLEIMATPITLLQQNEALSPSLIKTTDGDLILHAPMFQISVEGGSANGVQQAALLPVQTLGTTPIVFEENSKQANTNTQNCIAYIEAQVASDRTYREPQSGTEVSVATTDKNKRSPGRPRKNDPSRHCDMKCDICGQEFVKQMEFKKHMEHHAEEKPHRCPKCPASFNIPTNFTLHMATHNTGEPKCPECGKKFARMASLKSHMLLHEKEENLFCTECEDAFSTRAQLDAHLKLHGEKWATEDVRKCKLCNKQFVQPALYRLHIREHYRLQTKVMKQTKRGTKHQTMYKCTICLKTFQKPSQLLRHIRVHTGEKPFKCPTCGRAFTQKGSLQIHMWQHKGIRPHSCVLCNAKFSQKGNLNAHILRVHNAPEGEPIYECTHCTCVFKKLGSLNGHMKRAHSNPVEETPPKTDNSTEADMLATVNNVISQLASLESTGNEPTMNSANPNSTNTNKNDILQQALKNSGLQGKSKTSNDTDPATRKESEARTSYVTLLDRAPDGSMRKYLTIKQRCIGNIRWYACSFCHKEFKKPSDLIRHLRIHTQEKPFKCSQCFRSFALKSTMIAHQRTHAGAKKYSCGSCSKTFACHGSLSAHAKLHAKTHKCSMCDKSFSSNGMLKSHIKSHTRNKSKISPEAESLVPQIVLQEPLVISDAGNKISVVHVQSKQGQVYNNADVARPHKCWVCHAAFRKISHLKQHYRRHTGERPYKCTKCDRRFTSNSVLKSHLHTHEDARPYSCSVCNTKFSTQSSMKRHLVTHSNKRPFMCPYCHKTFKTSVNCRKHMKIHKQELALRQLEQQKSAKQNSEKPPDDPKKSATTLVENLTLSKDIEVSFQPQMAPDFTQAFSDQFQSITSEKEKSFLSTGNSAQPIVNQSLPEVQVTSIGSSHTLHADETGTITLPNYSGEQTLTPESIREIEETLNQQLFSIGMNLGLGNNLSRQIDDTSTSPLESREPPVLNIIYENSKNLESSGNSMFTSHFDSFDISQITLQSDSEIDIGLNATNSTSMSSILPRTSQEEQRLAPVITTHNIVNNQLKVDNRPMLIVSPVENCSELSNLVRNCQKFPKIVPKTDTINTREVQTIDRLEEHESSSCQNDRNACSTLSCEVCNETFPTTSDLKTHSKIHGLSNVVIRPDDSLLQCHICNQRSLTTSELKEHLKIHRTTKEFQCSECSLRFCTNGGLSRHLKMHASKHGKTHLKSDSKIHESNWNAGLKPQNSQQTPISVDTSSISTLDVRIDTDSSVSEKVLLDTVVEKEIMERVNGGKQTKDKAKKEYTNKCKYCPKTFRKPSDLIRHIRTHTGERPYKCNHCNKSFAVKCTLDSHMKVHTGAKTFSCHVCSSMFATKGSLKVHMRLHTGSKPFRCPVCDLRFRTSGHRKVHLLKHAREHKGSPKRKQKHLKVAAIAEVASNVEKSVEIIPQTIQVETDVTLNPTTTIEYPQLDSINIDTSGITNQITFNTDGTILNNNSMLSINESNQLVANLHFLLANGLATIQTDDILIAPAQNVDVSQNETRVAELITTSTLEVPCNDSTNQLVITSQVPTNVTAPADHTTVQLNNCMSLIQTDQNNAKAVKIDRLPNKSSTKGNQSKKECDICGKTFMKPYQVERHKRIHTGERPYKCELCTKSFAQKSTLQVHQKHHTGDRPHSCPHCEYSFTQKGNLQTHLKRVHQLDTLEFKKLRRSQQDLGAKLTQENLGEAKILNLDDISFVEFLK